MKKLLKIVICFFMVLPLSISPKIKDQPLKVLHLCLHRGCASDFAEVARELSLDLTTWYIFDLPLCQLDGYPLGMRVYNMGHDRAKRIWDKNKNFFHQFDVIVTSDTTPLSRIFLQNNWNKPLIIWVCNRFDISYPPCLDCNFPDQEYYDLIQKATQQENVHIISYTPYEHHYTQSKGIDIGTNTIKPIGSIKSNYKSAIPTEIEKEETFFIYPRISPSQINYVQKKCMETNIKTYSNNFDSPNDLKGFKGIIYFPYQFSNLALFENIQLGLIHFVPSEKFLKNLVNCKVARPFNPSDFQLCEWYCPEHRKLLVYFDSWQDLKEKVETTDYAPMRKKIKSFALKHRKKMLSKWHALFNKCKKYLANIHEKFGPYRDCIAETIEN